MKTLKEYLENANCYLYNLSGEELEREKNRILEYAKTGMYEEKFLKQVASTPEWKSLAEKSEIKFHIEETLKQNKGSVRNAFIEPGIFIRIYDNGKTPVIKVVI